MPAAVSVSGPARAAPVYDMRVLMGAPNPMAGAVPAPAPQTGPAPVPARERVTPAPRAAPVLVPAPALPQAGMVSGTQLYDMSIFLGRPGLPGAAAPFPVSAPPPVSNGAGYDGGFNDFGAVSDTPVEDSSDENDPLEPFNRMMFQFNRLVQDIFLEPAAYAYTAVMPDAAMNAVDNAMTNLGEPVTLANDILQLEFDRAWNTTQRTAVNTTVGVAGLFDVAGDLGVPYHSEDFGQTLAVYGVPEPFYLVLPVYGPSNPRDASKFFVHKYMDGYGYLIGRHAPKGVGFGLQALGGINTWRKVRKDLMTMQETSIDYYAALRSLYRQNRAGEIANSDGVYVPDDLDYDLDGDF